MKTVMKVLSVILCLIMVLGSVAIGADDYLFFDIIASADSGDCGNNTTWNYNEGSKTLTIAGVGKTNDYNVNNGIVSGAPWTSFFDSIENLVIESGVTYLGASSFYGCSTLKSVYIKNGLEEIGRWAFAKCSLIESIYLPDSVKKVGYHAFDGCEQLSDIHMSESIESVGESFIDGTAYYKNEANWIGKDLYLGKCYVKGNYSVGMNEDIEQFEVCSIRTGTRCIAPSALEFCEKLESVQIPETVVSIGYEAFSGCINLKNINIPKGLLRLESRLFGSCGSLVNICLPDSLEEIEPYAFYYCSSLESITIPENVKTIGACALKGCSSLKTVHFNAIDCQIKSYPTWTADTPTIENFIIGSNVQYLRRGIMWFADNCALEELFIPSGVVSIDGSAVSCNNLKKVSIPVSLTQINKNAFSGCANITDVYYEGTEEQWIEIKGNQVIDIQDATIHYNCTGPDELYFEQDIYKLALGESFVLKPIMKLDAYADDDLIWNSSDSSIVSVQNMPLVNDLQGAVEAKERGYATITVSTEDGKYSASCLVFVGDRALFVASDGLIGKGKIGSYIVGLVDLKGIKKDSKNIFKLSNHLYASEEELSNITFTIANPEIVSIEAIQRKDGCLFIDLKGLKAGTTYFTVSDNTTGEVKYAQIAVSDTECTYGINSIPMTEKKGGIFNFSKNFL
ncbi:MAG: leucine-rich repeat protein, partial [Clostridia bacterium]|nr:leucine-rich repeat protein [Clostridia bacterium]